MAAELQVAYSDTKALKPNKRNTRSHSPAQIAAIARSLTEFGWTNPILVDDKSTIIAGHARFEAAKHLGMKSVPIIRLSTLTKEQVRAYVIADNKLALNSEWDYDALGEELKAILEGGTDAELLGFTADEAADIIKGWDSDIDPFEPVDGSGKEATKLVVILEKAGDMTKAKTKLRKAFEDAGIGFKFNK